jgi:hypothetical protein
LRLESLDIVADLFGQVAGLRPFGNFVQTDEQRCDVDDDKKGVIGRREVARNGGAPLCIR